VYVDPAPDAAPAPPPSLPAGPEPGYEPDFRDRTAELAVVRPPGRAARRAAAAAPGDGTPGGGTPGGGTPGGRAARRKALQEEQKGARRRGKPRTGAAAELPPGAGRAARRKAAKPSAKARVITGVATGIGELAMTAGLVMVLFVVYTTWWTNVVGHRNANREANSLQDQWDQSQKDGVPPPAPDPRQPDGFAPGAGFALLYIPKLGVRVPVAQGTDKQKVLDKGLAGHYTDPKTAMPWDNQGNFAVAAHRNTHGEPFRYINKLVAGDKLVVETSTTYYTYVVTNTLPETSPKDIAVIDPVPKKSGFKGPGRYITLTTCTPDGHSTYRLIVWGQLQEERPRKDGKPDALVKDT
jgi:sortase A